MKELLLDLYFAPLRALEVVHGAWRRFYDLPAYTNGFPASAEDRTAYHLTSLTIVGFVIISVLVVLLETL